VKKFDLRFSPPSAPVPSFRLSRYRMHRQACRRGGIGAGCEGEGETQNLMHRVRENGLPPGLADRHVLRVSPLECAGRACEAHKAVAKIGRQTAERPEFGHKPPNGALEGAILSYSYRGVLQRPVRVRCMVETRAEGLRGVLACRFVWVITVEVLPWLTPLCPAGHLPHKGGDRQVARLSPYAEVGASGRAQPISLLVGEMSGRTEGGAAGTAAEKPRGTAAETPRARQQQSAPQDAGVNRATRACLSPG